MTRRHAIAALVGCGVLGGSRISGGVDVAETTHSDLEQTQIARARGHASNAPWLTLPITPMLPQTTRSGLAAVNGTNVFFAQFGEGLPVLLLHGGLANSNYWGYQVASLAQSFLVTVMDTRGHGRSPLTSSALGYDLFAEDVVSLLDFLKIPAVSIVGWSDGAITGLQLAMTRPNRVSRLFAFGANSSIDGLKANGARSRVFTMFAERCKNEYALLSPYPNRWPELVNDLRLMWRREPNFSEQDLAAIKVPTTISDGEFDEIVKRDHAVRLALAIPGARLEILPAVSHFAMLQNPTQFNAAVMEFLTPRAGQ